MTISIIARFVIFIASAFAAIYGMSQYFKKNVALFNLLIVCAMSCIMLGRLFTLLYLLLWGETMTGFNVSMLGSFGGFLFLFSAGYGQMDGLVDGHQKDLRLYRLVSLFAPLVIIIIALAILATDVKSQTKTAGLIMLIPMALSSYYNLKHYIIPDVEFGILDAIRNYNLTVLWLCIISALEIYFEIADLTLPLAICEMILAGLYTALIPILKGGSSKWIV